MHFLSTLSLSLWITLLSTSTRGEAASFKNATYIPELFDLFLHLKLGKNANSLVTQQMHKPDFKRTHFLDVSLNKIFHVSPLKLKYFY